MRYYVCDDDQSKKDVVFRRKYLSKLTGLTTQNLS